MAIRITKTDYERLSRMLENVNYQVEQNRPRLALKCWWLVVRDITLTARQTHLSDKRRRLNSDIDKYNFENQIMNDLSEL